MSSQNWLGPLLKEIKHETNMFVSPIKNEIC